jgi:hypothetical protein
MYKFIDIFCYYDNIDRLLFIKDIVFDIKYCGVPVHSTWKLCISTRWLHVIFQTLSVCPSPTVNCSVCLYAKMENKLDGLLQFEKFNLYEFNWDNFFCQKKKQLG